MPDYSAGMKREGWVAIGELQPCWGGEHMPDYSTGMKREGWVAVGELQPCM